MKKLIKLFSKFFKNPWEKIYQLGVPNDMVHPYKNFQLILELIKNHETKNKKILDVAMGHGRHALILIELGYDISGFDLSSQAVEMAKKNVSDKFPKYDLSKFKTGNMFKKFPFSNESFDKIIAVQAIYHGFRCDMEQAISEATRVLKKNGLFTFTVSTDIKRSTTATHSISERKNITLKIEDMTYIPLSGREKGLVHFYPTKDLIRKILVKDYEHVIIHQDLENQYFIVSCLKK
jgi:ubiquinone/menaquinone biosynthesis C-methylase UbiE